MNEETLAESAERKTSPVASFYDGDALSNFYFTVISFLCRILTLDIAAPIVICLRLRWRAEHTCLNGRRMVFTGEIKDLFKKNLLWVLLSVVTAGIFIPFKMIKTAEWETAHFHFAGVPEAEYSAQKSRLCLKWYTYFGIQMACFWGSLFSLGIARFALYVFKERKITGNTLIDGHRLEFTATAAAYFKRRALWLLFSIVTLGIYAILLKGKLMRWKISNTSVQAPQTIPYCAETAGRQQVHPVNRNAYIGFFMLFPAILFIVCAWSSKVLLRHGIYNPISIIPIAINLAAAALVCVDVFILSKAYKFSLAEKSGKSLPVGLIAACCVLLAVCAAFFVYFLLLLF